MKEGAKDDEDGGEDEGDTKVVAGEGPDEGLLGMGTCGSRWAAGFLRTNSFIVNPTHPHISYSIPFGALCIN